MDSHGFTRLPPETTLNASELVPQLDRLGSILSLLADKRLHRQKGETANFDYEFYEKILSTVQKELWRITDHLRKNNLVKNPGDGLNVDKAGGRTFHFSTSNSNGGFNSTNADEIFAKFLESSNNGNNDFAASSRSPKNPNGNIGSPSTDTRNHGLHSRRRNRSPALSIVSSQSYERRRPAPKTGPSSSSEENRANRDMANSPPASPYDVHRSPRKAKYSDVPFSPKLHEHETHRDPERRRKHRHKHRTSTNGDTTDDVTVADASERKAERPESSHKAQHHHKSSIGSQTPATDYEAEVLDRETPDPPDPWLVSFTFKRPDDGTAKGKPWGTAEITRDRDRSQAALRSEVDQHFAARSTAGKRHRVRLSELKGPKRLHVEKLTKTYDDAEGLGESSKHRWTASFIEVEKASNTSDAGDLEKTEIPHIMRVIIERVKKPILSDVRSYQH